MIDNLIKPLTKAVPFIMQEVYLCGVDTDLGLNIPRICCPDQALGLTVTKEEVEEKKKEKEKEKENLVTTTTTTTTTTTRTPLPWYRTHPGFQQLGSLETCGRSFVNVSRQTAVSLPD